MHIRTRDLIRSVTTAAALLAVPGVLLAQDPDPEGYDEDPVMTGSPTVDLEADAGVALPAADFMEFNDAGFAAGVGGALWLHDNVAVRADADFAHLNGEEEGLVAEAVTPDMQLYHYGLGLELDVVGRSAPSPWNFAVNAGVGGTTLDTDDFLEEPAADEERDITKTYPNVNAGLELGRQVSEDVVVSVSTQAFWTMIDEVDLEPLSERRVTETLENGVSVPVTLSIRYDLPG